MLITLTLEVWLCFSQLRLATLDGRKQIRRRRKHYRLLPGFLTFGSAPLISLLSRCSAAFSP